MITRYLCRRQIVYIPLCSINLVFQSFPFLVREQTVQILLFINFQQCRELFRGSKHPEKIKTLFQKASLSFFLSLSLSKKTTNFVKKHFSLSSQKPLLVLRKLLIKSRDVFSLSKLNFFASLC